MVLLLSGWVFGFGLMCVACGICGFAVLVVLGWLNDWFVVSVIFVGLG